jgi:hypothetical protein
MAIWLATTGANVSPETAFATLKTLVGVWEGRTEVVTFTRAGTARR